MLNEKTRQDPNRRSYRYFDNVDRIPAALDLVRSITGLFDQQNASESVIEVPQINGRHASLEIPSTSNKQPFVKTSHVHSTAHISMQYGGLLVTVRGLQLEGTGSNLPTKTIP